MCSIHPPKIGPRMRRPSGFFILLLFSSDQRVLWHLGMGPEWNIYHHGRCVQDLVRGARYDEYTVHVYVHVHMAPVVHSLALAIHIFVYTTGKRKWLAPCGVRPISCYAMVCSTGHTFIAYSVREVRRWQYCGLKRSGASKLLTKAVCLFQQCTLWSSILLTSSHYVMNTACDPLLCYIMICVDIPLLMIFEEWSTWC